MIKPLCKLLAVGGLAFAIAGCGQNQPEIKASEPVSGMRQGSDYQKPGAPVRLAHNYGGKSQAGVAELITLSFTPEYDLSNVTIDVKSSSESLQVDSVAYSAAAKGGEAIDIPTTVVAGQDGRYYLNMSVVTTTSGGQKSSRSYSLAIVVGDAPLKKPDNPVTADGETIRIIPAEEKIR